MVKLDAAALQLVAQRPAQLQHVGERDNASHRVTISLSDAANGIDEGLDGLCSIYAAGYCHVLDVPQDGPRERFRGNTAIAVGMTMEIGRGEAEEGVISARDDEREGAGHAVISRKYVEHYRDALPSRATFFLVLPGIPEAVVLRVAKHRTKRNRARALWRAIPPRPI